MLVDTQIDYFQKYLFAGLQRVKEKIFLGGVFGVLLLFSSVLIAADKKEIAAAEACTAISYSDEFNGFERAQWHHQTVQCLKDLYILVGAPDGSREIKAEIRKRLDALENTFYASRALCDIQHRMGTDTGGCGTLSLSSREFRQLLRMMIINEDAGWVRVDPALQSALGIH